MIKTVIVSYIIVLIILIISTTLFYINIDRPERESAIKYKKTKMKNIKTFKQFLNEANTPFTPVQTLKDDLENAFFNNWEALPRGVEMPWAEVIKKLKKGKVKVSLAEFSDLITKFANGDYENTFLDDEDNYWVDVNLKKKTITLYDPADI